MPESIQLQEVVAPTDEVKDLIKRAFDIFRDNVNKNLPDTGVEGSSVLAGLYGKKVR